MENGEFEKRLKLFKEVIDESRNDFPDDGAVEKAIDMMENFYPISNAFSKRYILAILRITDNAMKKWYGT